jgi:hypothetical protein
LVNQGGVVNHGRWDQVRRTFQGRRLSHGAGALRQDQGAHSHRKGHRKGLYLMLGRHREMSNEVGEIAETEMKRK